MSEGDIIQAQEVLEEITPELIDEISGKKKRNSLLNEVLVTGLLKNINEKVNNKLDTDAQSELVDIISERVKDGYDGEGIDLESEIEKAISFDDDPTNDHVITNANKNRVKIPSNRRPPSKESKSANSDVFDQLINLEDNGNSQVDEDFDKLFEDEDEADLTSATDIEQKELMEKSIIDDFDALLQDDNSNTKEDEIEKPLDIDADFDALLKAENIQIEAKQEVTSTEKNEQSELENIDNKDDLNDDLAPTKSSVDTAGNPVLLEISDNENECVKEHVSADENPANNISDSLEDIFEKLETSGENLAELKDLLATSVDNDDSAKEDMQASTETAKDPFDDLFAQLDKTNIENAEVGFQQIVEDKKEDDPNLENQKEDLSDATEQNDQEKKVIPDDSFMEEISQNLEADASNIQSQLEDKESGKSQEVEAEIMEPLYSNESEEKLDEKKLEDIKDEVGKENVESNDETSYELGTEFRNTSQREDLLEMEVKQLKEKVEQLEKEKKSLKSRIEMLSHKQDVLEINKNGKKVIVPTESHDQEMLEEEIRNDTREAELLIQLKHLSERVEVQDTLLAETKEDNTVLRIQNQSLLESLNKALANTKTKKKSFDTPSLDWIESDDSNEKKKMFLLEQELEDQKEVNKQLKAYVGDILINIIVQNPQILEKKPESEC